ncbi:MAG: hypothetical protein K0R14_1903 [Burkholderiales bacterium]|jgi:hypothetical protein|nr:hypothetical protein [Burkholderiales bacterium]
MKNRMMYLLTFCSVLINVEAASSASCYLNPQKTYTCCQAKGSFYLNPADQANNSAKGRSNFPPFSIWLSQGTCPSENKHDNQGSKYYYETSNTCNQSDYVKNDTTLYSNLFYGDEKKNTLKTLNYACGSSSQVDHPVVDGLIERVCVWSEYTSDTPKKKTYKFLTLVYNNLFKDTIYPKNNLPISAYKALGNYHDIDETNPNKLLANQEGNAEFNGTYITKWTFGRDTITLTPYGTPEKLQWVVKFEDTVTHETSGDTTNAKCMLFDDIIAHGNIQYPNRDEWFKALPSY